MPEKATVHLINLQIKKPIITKADWDECRRRYTTINKYNDSCAMLWYVNNGYLGDATEFNILHIDDIKEKYPDLVPMMKRGDLIENICESGYRSQGIYCFDGTDIVCQDQRHDNYGTPSSSFRLINEFPPGYWDNPKVNDKLEPIHESQFYWHSDHTYSKINVNDYEECEIDDINKIATFTHNKKQYIVKYYSRETVESDMYVRKLSAGEVRHKYNKLCKKLKGIKNGKYHHMLIADY